ncbi:hypothetical protein [Actinoplanes xinjiangensis]|uniref:hypothetical protein n=1 Tax=Actinoplanes xinjiangensis TaxID=512350 RepID=UPI003433EEB2
MNIGHMSQQRRDLLLIVGTLAAVGALLLSSVTGAIAVAAWLLPQPPGQFFTPIRLAYLWKADRVCEKHVEDMSDLAPLNGRDPTGDLGVRAAHLQHRESLLGSWSQIRLPLGDRIQATEVLADLDTLIAHEQRLLDLLEKNGGRWSAAAHSEADRVADLGLEFRHSARQFGLQWCDDAWRDPLRGS